MNEKPGRRREGEVTGDAKAPLGGHSTIIKGIFVEFDDESVGGIADGAEKSGPTVGHPTNHLTSDLFLLLIEDAVSLSQNQGFVFR